MAARSTLRVTAADLIGFGCDLQQKLDALDPNQRRARWAGDVAIELHKIATRLHRLDVRTAKGTRKPSDNRTEHRLIERAKDQLAKLGRGISVVRQPDSTGWPLYVVFPGDVPKGSDPQVYFEQGVAIPPQTQEGKLEC